jgi:hypothetical protein
MNTSRPPLIALPLLALAIASMGALAFAVIGEAFTRGAYQVWQENETFVAAVVALIAAMFAARPVYLQVRAQSAQAALDLLHRTEVDTEACIEARAKLFDVRRAAVSFAAEIEAYADGADPTDADVRDAMRIFMDVEPHELRALAERPTIPHSEQSRLVALSAVLAIAQAVAREMMAQERDGVLPREVVMCERAFIRVKLAGLFALSTEIADDLEVQEAAMRARAQVLRRTADDSFM